MAQSGKTFGGNLAIICEVTVALLAVLSFFGYKTYTDFSKSKNMRSHPAALRSSHLPRSIGSGTKMHEDVSKVDKKTASTISTDEKKHGFTFVREIDVVIHARPVSKADGFVENVKEYEIVWPKGSNRHLTLELRRTGYYEIIPCLIHTCSSGSGRSTLLVPEEIRAGIQKTIILRNNEFRVVITIPDYVLGTVPVKSDKPNLFFKQIHLHIVVWANNAPNTTTIEY